MSERSSVRFGDTTIDYDVRRSERRRKTVQITVDGGGVQVAAPMATPVSELRAIVRKRRPGYWARRPMRYWRPRPSASSAARRCRTWAATSAC